jgi:integrase
MVQLCMHCVPNITERPEGPQAIHQVGVRRELPPSKVPYWAPPLEAGKYLGFRKIDASRGSWIARLWLTDAKKQKFKALGFESPQRDFKWAKSAAEAFFKLHESGITDDRYTVADACRAYVADLRSAKRADTAQDAEKRFERTVYDHDVGARPLAKLRTPDLKTWRDGLELSKASANRTMISLKAALNHAVAQRKVSPAAVIEWRQVKPHKGAGKRRDLYLDIKQRRALLKAATGAVRNLMEAAILTGARAGELVKATVSQFDARTKSMTFSGKTGTRKVPVSPDAVKLFAKLAEGRKPGQRLLVRDDGASWSHSDWDELVRAAATAAELPAEPKTGVCLYTLRHSFITEALTKGLSTLDVARLTGTSVMMIEKHYGHLVASAARERLAKVAMV